MYGTIEVLDSGLTGAVACPRGQASGNNSVVECDLAKVEVAGSNPVSRSNFRSRLPTSRELRLASHAKADQGFLLLASNVVSDNVCFFRSLRSSLLAVSIDAAGHSK